MKTLIFIWLIAVSSLCQAQRVDVFIVGTVHRFDDEYKELQNFEKVQQDIIAYNPDIICIEAIPVDDTLSLQEIWPKNMKRADDLKSRLDNNAFDATASPTQIEGAELYAMYDFWNAWFVWDSLEANGDTTGIFSQYHRNMKNSEYGNIVFPAARKLGMARLQTIDYRIGESIFLENQNKALKQLLFRLKWKPLRTYLKLQKKYRKAHEAGLLMEYVNGDEFQNAFGNLIDELPSKLKKSEEARAVKESWHLRNKIMADRIHQAARDHGSTRVLVTVGSAHVGHIKYYLEQLDCSVTTYGEFLSQSKNN